MTRARNAAKGFGTPPPLHRWMEAVLLLCVSLVQGAASTLQMIFNRNTRDWHTTTAQEALPRETSDIHASAFILRDDRRSALIPQDEAGGPLTESRSPNKHGSTQAIILRDLRFTQIVSKDEGVLTALSALIPTNVGIQGRRRAMSKLAASSLHPQPNRSWIPTFVGMSGSCRGNTRVPTA